ncbi:MAG: hypothetical protein C5S38_05775 [Candidatus Methanophagaceae archaeon]|nr:MAG: hypothetical protein C5S38_05775 [Methanophagales archaeon]
MKSSTPTAILNAPIVNPNTLKINKPDTANRISIPAEYVNDFFMVACFCLRDIFSVSAMKIAEVEIGLEITMIAIIAPMLNVKA